MAVEVHLNLGPIERLANIPQSVFRSWAARYRGFAVERFSIFSRGGGTWAPLKPSTLARRRRGRGRGPIASILWDTGTLVGALSPRVRKRGRFESLFDRGIVVGYGGGDRHPKGGTIAAIAAAHQRGDRKRNLPARPIIVEPPQHVLDRMAQDVTDWWKSQ